MKVSGFLRGFLCVLLAGLLVCTAALAGSVDLSGMTDDEVVELLADVNAEVARRGISKTAELSPGSYIAGRDVPPGRYILTCLAKGSDWGNLTVRPGGPSGSLDVWEVLAAPEKGEDPETVFITLNDGDELKCDVPFSLTIMSGVVFR